MTLLELVENKTGFKKQSANTYEGPCPKCGGTKRFVVWTKKDIFKCRECDFKGDLVKYLREAEGYSCREAFLAAGKDCGATSCPAYEKCKGNTAPRRSNAKSVLPPAGKKEDWQPRAAEKPLELWRQKAAEFVAWAHEQLLANPEHLEYLANRGLPLEAVKKYRLGFNPGTESKGKPGPLFKQRASWGLEKKRSEDDTKWITVFPIQRGTIIPSFQGDDVYRIRIRRLDEDLDGYPKDKRPPKYLFLDGSGKGLVIRNPDAKAFMPVEADLDDLLIDWAAGDIICSVALTSCNIRPDSDSAVILANAVCLLNALDFEPRQNATTGAHENPGGQNARWWQKHFPRSERWPVPVGKDPGEAYQAGVDLRQWVIAGLPVSLQPRQKGVSKQEAHVDTIKMQQLISDTYSRVYSLCPKGAQEWLDRHRPDVLVHLAQAGKAVDAAFEAEDAAALTKALETWEAWHLAAWKRYQERPQVLER